MAPCPICRRNAATPEHKPFCSQRCADVDLQGWLGGKYVVPGQDDAERTRDFPDDED